MRKKTIIRITKKMCITFVMRFFDLKKMKKYNKKSGYMRVTINCGKEGDPVHDIIKRKMNKGENQSEIFRDAALTMWSNDVGYKQRKIDFYKKRLLQNINDSRILSQERNKLVKELEKMKVSNEEIGELYD